MALFKYFCNSIYTGENSVSRRGNLVLCSIIIKKVKDAGGVEAVTFVSFWSGKSNEYCSFLWITMACGIIALIEKFVFASGNSSFMEKRFP